MGGLLFLSVLVVSFVIQDEEGKFVFASIFLQKRKEMYLVCTVWTVADRSIVRIS